MNKYSKIKSSYLKKYSFLALLLVMVGVTGYVANVLIQKNNTYQVGASAGNASLFFQPESLVSPPNALVNLWVTADKPVGFIRAEFAFDNSLLKLNDEIALSTPPLKKILVSSMSEANATGKVVLVLGIDHTQFNSAPSGSFKIAGLNMSPKVTTSNLSTQINMISSSLQLVDTSAVPFALTSSSAAFTLNPITSPIPTSTPISSPNPSPNTDRTPPSVIITSPLSGTVIASNTRVTISANASDNIGVREVQFYVNNILHCTAVAAPYTCQWTMPRGNKSPQIRAVATDAAGNSSANTVTVRTR